MRALSLLFLLIAATFADSSYAQNWTAYDPDERDFRVLFPAPPERSTGADGSIAFKSAYHNAEDTVAYNVYRLPRAVQRVDDARNEIRRRLEARIGDDVTSVPEQDDGPGWERHVFRFLGSVSVHRLVGHAGRYYELEVVMPRGSAGTAMGTARDFFNSFQVTGAPLSSIGIAVGQRIEAWCQGRTDPFTRALCVYSVCIQPGYEKYPQCTALFRR